MKFQGHPTPHGDSTKYSKKPQSGPTLSQRSQAATKGVKQAKGSSKFQGSTQKGSTTVFDK